jgi:hypothetical protein
LVCSELDIEMAPIFGDIGLFQTHDCESWHRASSNGVASTIQDHYCAERQIRSVGLKKEIKRGFIASQGQPLCIADLLPHCYPRVARTQELHGSSGGTAPM